MRDVAEPVGTLDIALRHAMQLLTGNPAAALNQAQEILKVMPGQPDAELILAQAQRRVGDVPAAVATLTSLIAKRDSWAGAHLELGLALAALGRGEEAVAALRKAVALQTDLPVAWLALGDHLSAMGDNEGADAAYAQHVRYSANDGRLMQAGTALIDNRLPEAEALLREHLKQRPTDVAAIRMLAELAARIGRYADAETLLIRCLELAPSFTAARHNYAVILHRQYKSSEALAQTNRLLEIDPNNPGYRNLKAAILGRLGEYEESSALYKSVLAHYPNQAKVWMSYGHALKTAGQQSESIDAYQRSIALAPGLGEAWWSLANLKTYRFTSNDVQEMSTQLLSGELTDEDRFHFHFALGKALEDAHEHAASFEHYHAGNALRRKSIAYDADDASKNIQRCKRLFTHDFFARRRGMGCAARDPIFIVGLPRAGSTLLEQILASHPLVEGTMELPDLSAIAREVGFNRVPDLSADELRGFGERYLEQTRIQRKTDAPFFIDKMPNNFLHAGFIQLILPNAKIIDARRHPLGCCFSVFKQHFARGQHFSYSLRDVGRYYADYVELMAHFDQVLPGRVHRVIYESIVADPEAQTRALLDYCGLPFDERCLRFYENDRAVRTASSEQVRQPIYRDSVDQWRQYDAYLQPLKEALGACLAAYPQAPSY